MTGTVADDHPDPGMARAGAAAAARRRQLDISQRSLAAEGIINAGALIAFEKGRSWPRAATRAKLEDVLEWSPGTIARLRDGREPDAAGTEAASAAGGSATPAKTAAEGPLIAEAVLTAAGALDSAVSTLPPTEDPRFTHRVTAILHDLRQLETVAARAARISPVHPNLVRALGTVRRRVDDLTLHAVSAPGATLGQRFYVARRRANLTLAETALVLGLAAETLVAVEADLLIAAETAVHVEEFIRQIDWH